MPSVNTYLNFNGTTEEAFNFYRSVFGGEFTALQRFKETPAGDKLSQADQEKIMHVALPVGNGNILMATDALESMGQKLITGNNISLSVEADSDEQAHELFNKLAVDGTITIPLATMFWGALFGMVTDKFGIQWMVNHDGGEQE